VKLTSQTKLLTFTPHHISIVSWPVADSLIQTFSRHIYIHTRTHARARARAHTHTHTHTVSFLNTVHSLLITVNY
jgi:hypothetical protein